MSHVFHDGLPGYDPRQILHDGCGTCEERGADLSLALANMDKQTFARAYKRAYDWQASGGDHNSVGAISSAEAQLLRVLWGVQVQLQGFGPELDLQRMQALVADGR